jgi:hypothetical protein
MTPILDDIEPDRVNLSGEDTPVSEEMIDTGGADMPNVTIRLGGCDDDNYGNALVAGYATNGGSETLKTLTIVALLTSESGDTVGKGERRVDISDLGVGETRRFSAIFEKPDAWKRCRAYVKAPAE